MTKKKVLATPRTSILPFNPEAEDLADDVVQMTEMVMSPAPAVQTPLERKSIGGNRRRSSLGFSAKTPLSEAEQIRIGNMYKLVLQLANENKINDKNSWNYDLIDHMRSVIRDDSKGINFQKASCTLDASVKIYSHRVDDTYNTSYRILENLSRNQRGNANEDDNDDQGEGDENIPANKPKSRSGPRNRTYFANTLGSSENQFNAEKIENDENCNPMFQKITKSFDEGGAKGLLLYNLKLSSKSCSLSFDESLLRAREKASALSSSAPLIKPNPYPNVNMKDLLQRSKLTSESIQDLKICTTLKNFRAALKIPEAKIDGLVNKLKDIEPVVSQYVPNPTQNAVESAIPFSSAGGFDGGEAMDVVPVDQGDCMEVDYWDNVHDDYVPVDAVNDVEEAPITGTGEIVLPSDPTSAAMASEDLFPVGGKLKWNVNETDRQQVAAENQQLVQSLDDKNHYDAALDIFEQSNAWAGANHWKYGRLRSKMKQLIETTNNSSGNETTNNQTEPGSVTAASSKTRSVKPKGSTFVLTMDYVEEAKFGVVKKQDSTLISKKQLAKQQEEAESHLLPADQKLQIRDLGRLLLMPNFLTSKNRNLMGGSRKTLSQAQRKDKYMTLFQQFESEEKVFLPMTGAATTTTATTDRIPGEAVDPANHYDDYYGGDAGGGAEEYYYDGGDYEAPTNNNDSSSSNQPFQPQILANRKEGLEISEDKLIQCDRKVAKTDITYAKISKRVNVHKLKADIWHEIQDTLLPATPSKSSPFPQPSQQSEKADESLSFQQLISEVSQTQHQEDASIQYYFICLLHLANEKGLRIEGQEDMSDLTIQVEGKK